MNKPQHLNSYKRVNSKYIGAIYRLHSARQTGAYRIVEFWKHKCNRKTKLLVQSLQFGYFKYTTKRLLEYYLQKSGGALMKGYDWFACEKCKGTGTTKYGRDDCASCDGVGFFWLETGNNKFFPARGHDGKVSPSLEVLDQLNDEN